MWRKKEGMGDKILKIRAVEATPDHLWVVASLQRTGITTDGQIALGRADLMRCYWLGS